jgi:hypothetical protein
MQCPSPEALPPIDDPVLTLEEPGHRHVDVGALRFCFRDVRQKGWTFQGTIIAATGHVVTENTWRESFALARDAMVRTMAGLAPAAKESRCPECGQIFAESPKFPGPFQWVCGPEHWVLSEDEESATLFVAGHPAQHFGPGEPRGA